MVGGLVVGGIAIAAASGGGSGGGSSSKSTTESTTENGYLADSPIIGARYERYDANVEKLVVWYNRNGVDYLFISQGKQ